MKKPRTFRQLALGLHPDAVLTWHTRPDSYRRVAETIYSVHWGGKPSEDSCQQVQSYDRTSAWERAYQKMLDDCWKGAL